MRQQTAMVATAVLLTLATLFVTEVTKSWGSNVQLATVLAVNILLLLGLSRFERPIRRRIGKIFDIKRIIGALKDLALQSPFAKSLHQRRFRLISETLFESLKDRPAPDVVHIHDHIALLAADRVKRRYACPIVWDAHEIYEDLASSSRQ